MESMFTMSILVIIKDKQVYITQIYMHGMNTEIGVNVTQFRLQ